MGQVGTTADKIELLFSTGDACAVRGAVEARVCLKLAHRILWGGDFRDPIPLPSIERWARRYVTDKAEPAALRPPRSTHSPE